MKKAYTHLLFDLDGTLFDTSPGVTTSVRHALVRMGRPIPSQELLLKFIGPPLHEGFMEYCGMSAEEAATARVRYREYYADRGLLECRLYDGMSETLAALHAAGYTLAVATSKPEVYATRILEHFDIARYFTYIAGSTLTEARTAKPEVIAYALESLGNPPASACLMIGDRRYDIEGAHALEMDGYGVLYGFGTREEMEAAGADRLFATPSELGDFLLSLRNF